MKICVIVFVCLALMACEKVVDLDYSGERKVCLNCILNPDSTVHLSLYYTWALDETGDFVPVDGATVVFFENGQSWGTAAKSTNGNYLLNKKPVIGNTYSVKASIPGSLPLTAETTIQEKPDITVVIRSKEKYEGWREFDESTHFYRLVLDYQLNDQPGKDFYWNYLLGWYEPWGRYNYSAMISYISPFIDDFNRVIEPETKYGYYYAYYVRLSDDGVDGEQLAFSKDLSTRSLDVFFNADEHYDKYMKTSVQQRVIDDEVLPFKEPVQIYSNIENGTGIFGSASFTYLNYHQ